MRIPRPSLRRRGPKDEDAALLARTAPDEDARLLRGTRFRLMAVSGAVTLLLLLVLGTAAYLIVSTAVESGSRDQLIASTVRSDRDDPYGFTVAGPTAGLIPILVTPQGTVVLPPGIRAIPSGLPNLDSLGAVTPANTIDVRDITLSDGTPYRVLSGYPDQGRYPGYKVQWAQGRTGEVNLFNTLRNVLLGGGLLALVASLLAGYLYAGRALVPIRQSIDRRQAALQRQREFTANASHELRTPLTVIRASVEDLRRNSRSRVADVGDALDDMDAEVRHLTALVEDMLLLARTDSGVVQLDRTPLDLADVTVEATSTLASLGQERGVSVVADPLPAPVLGDPLRLRQLVTILVDNAIRHSPSGTTVTVRVRPANGAAFLWVEDEGHGIKPEDLPRLFERFWRADNAPVGGTGLGLSIARWIVQQHGGTIGAENRPEGGARFWAQIPLLSSNPGVAPGPDPWANPAATSRAEAIPSDHADETPMWTPGDQDQTVV
jgi:signal transduction histidine kinase